MIQAELKQAALGKKAMAAADSATKKKALLAMAQCLRQECEQILQANAQDMAEAEGSISPVMMDRLRLDKARVEAMAEGMEAVAELPDPVGVVVTERQRPNGVRIEKVASPMGVIAIIYESRPNVTSDAAALALMAGSACILRSGKEAHATASAIVSALQLGLTTAGLPREVVTLIGDTSRDSATALMTANGQVDLLIPRGGKGLISACVTHATVPVVETGTGICHAYVDKEADLDMALSIVENGKASRPSVCNALEVCLVHEAVAAAFLPQLLHKLCHQRKAEGQIPVELRVDAKAKSMLSDEFVVDAGENDFDTEFLDYILAVKVVDSVEMAIEHINEHSTGHSEVILTQNSKTAQIFTNFVDSSAVYVNASTRFTDGGEFGLGCEMGISTQKLHARGPMGLEELCSYKYVLTGDGQVR